MTTEHSNLPWVIGKSYIDDVIAIREDDDEGDCIIQVLIGSDPEKAKKTAQFILRACRSHDALLDTAKWLIQEREAGTDKGLLPDGLLIKADIAITKAEESEN